MKCAKLDASPQKPSLELIIGDFALKAKQRLIGFGYMHVLVMHGMSSLILLIVTYEHWVKEDTKSHQL